MNDIDPTGTTPGTNSSEPPRAGERPRPRRAISALTAAPALALTALATAPLAAAVRVASHLGDPQTVTLLADKCDTALTNGTLYVLKWPDCGGD